MKTNELSVFLKSLNVDIALFLRFLTFSINPKLVDKPHKQNKIPKMIFLVLSNSSPALHSKFWVKYPCMINLSPPSQKLCHHWITMYWHWN